MDLGALKTKVDRDRTAVAVIDMQRDYCCEGGIFHRRGFDIIPIRELADRLSLFLDRVRPALKCIVHLKMTKLDELSSPAAKEQYDRLGIDRKYDPDYAGFYGVFPRRGDVVIAKYSYSGFASTYLDRFLRSRGIRTLVITGIATNVCVESTARDAFMRDYFVVVPSDLTEGTSEEAKKWSLSNIDGFFGEVVDSEDLLHCWR